MSFLEFLTFLNELIYGAFKDQLVSDEHDINFNHHNENWNDEYKIKFTKN